MVDDSVRVKRDANRVPIQGLNSLLAKKRAVFDGGAGSGAVGTMTLFTVTGDVMIRLLGIVKQSLAGAGTLKVGVTGATADILSQLADATELNLNEAWFVDAFPGLGKGKDQIRTNVIGGGLDVIATIGTTDITEGIIDFYCFWYPLSDDGNVVAA